MTINDQLLQKISLHDQLLENYGLEEMRNRCLTVCSFQIDFSVGNSSFLRLSISPDYTVHTHLIPPPHTHNLHSLAFSVSIPFFSPSLPQSSQV